MALVEAEDRRAVPGTVAVVCELLVRAEHGVEVRATRCNGMDPCIKSAAFDGSPAGARLLIEALERAVTWIEEKR